MIKLLNHEYNRKQWSWTPKVTIPRGDDIITVINQYRGYWPLTERMVFYRLISSPLIKAPHWKKNGNPNKKQVDVYAAIGRTLKWLRIHDKVPWSAITDEHRILSDKQGFESIDSFVESEIYWFLNGYRKCLASKQENYIEVWIEKNTLYHIVQPVVDRLCRRTIVCRGYNSISFQTDYYDRATEAIMRGQKPIILYFGDWDPSGCDMPYAILKTLEYELGLTNIGFYRCGINPDHFDSLQADPVPVKGTDSRAKNFIKDHGNIAYELDAFEPSELQALVQTSLEAFTNMDAIEADKAEEEKEKIMLESLRGDVKAYIQDWGSL